MGNPNPNIGFQKFTLLSNVCWIQRWIIFFSICPNIAVISPENSTQGQSRQTKCTGMHHNFNCVQRISKISVVNQLMCGQRSLPEKISEFFFNVGGTRTKTAVSAISCTLPTGSVLMQTFFVFFSYCLLSTTCCEIKMYIHDSKRSKAVRFEGLNPPKSSCQESQIHETFRVT